MLAGLLLSIDTEMQSQTADERWTLKGGFLRLRVSVGRTGAHAPGKAGAGRKPRKAIGSGP